MHASEIRKGMNSLLRGLTAQQVEQLAQASVGQKVAAGHALMNEGDRSSGLVFLLHGGVEIFKHGADGQRESLAKVDAPTLLGEMSLITDRPSSATVMAVTESELQLLSAKAQFQRLIASDSIAAYKLIAILAGVLAERVARLDRKVLELTGHWNLSPRRRRASRLLRDLALALAEQRLAEHTERLLAVGETDLAHAEPRRLAEQDRREPGVGYVPHLDRDGSAALRHANHRWMTVADRPHAVARARRRLTDERRAGSEQIVVQREAAHQGAVDRQSNAQDALSPGWRAARAGGSVRP